MPALLFLRHRRRARLDLFARADPGLRRGRLWCPFRLQFYGNGHSWLALKLTAAGIGFTLADNAFVRVDDWQRAQTLADQLLPAELHRILDRYAKQCCPVFDVFAPSYHWSFLRAEHQISGVLIMVRVTGSEFHNGASVGACRSSGRVRPRMGKRDKWVLRNRCLLRVDSR